MVALLWWKASLKRRVVLVPAALLAAGPAAAEPQRATRNPVPAAADAPVVQTKAQLPGAEEIVTLIRTAVLTLNDAVQTGNFTVLRDRGAPSFQAANTAARLSQIFRSLRQQGLDLSSVAVTAPKLTEGPAIDTDRRLHVAGYFPARPVAVKFGLIFEVSGGRWSLFAISVNPAASNAANVDLPKFAPNQDMVVGGGK